VSFVSEILTHCFPLNYNPPAGAFDGAEATDGDGPDEFLRGDVALAAVLLDAVGASPADFRRGIHVIHAPPALIEGVKEVITKTSGIAFCDVHARRRPTDAMWVTSVFDEPTIISGLQANATMIGIAESDADLPSGFAAVADRIWSIPWVDRQHIEFAIRLMTGEPASLPDCQYHLSSVLKALRPGVGAAKVVAVLEALHNDDGPADEANASTALAEWLDVVDETLGVDRPGEHSSRKAVKKVTRLRDLAGFGEARDWGLQLAADFAEFKAGRLGWEDVDKGLLLSGPPGSGKTFFAVALAAECEVPLLRSSYADWEAATGPGNLIAEAIQKAFAEARKEAPCIVFIDECRFPRRTDPGFPLRTDPALMLV
jgi:hypothetical protein